MRYREAMAGQMVRLSPFLGENHFLPDDQLQSENGAFVRQAVNVDLSSRGTFFRRQGYLKLLPCQNAHSLWSNEKRCFYADGNTLFELHLNAQRQFESRTLLENLRAGRFLSYADTPAGIYLTDGLSLYRLAGSRVIEVNQQAPHLPRLTKIEGVLPKGVYLITVRYENEAAIAPIQMIELKEAGGILVDVINPQNKKIEIYASTCNGKTLYLQKNNALTVDIFTDSKTLEDCDESCMQAGSLLAYFYGRLLSVNKEFVCYSKLYDLDKMDVATGYIAFDSPLQMCLPVDEGLYVASAHKTYFCEGRNIEELNFKEILPYGAVFGTSGRMDDGSFFWFSPKGLVKANSLGEATNVQINKVAIVPAKKGAGIFIKENGNSKIIVSAFEKQERHSKSALDAAKDFLTIEQHRKEDENA